MTSGGVIFDGMIAECMANGGPAYRLAASASGELLYDGSACPILPFIQPCPCDDPR